MRKRASDTVRRWARPDHREERVGLSTGRHAGDGEHPAPRPVQQRRQLLVEFRVGGVQHAFTALARSLVVTHARGELLITYGESCLDLWHGELVVAEQRLLTLQRVELVKHRLA